MIFYLKTFADKKKVFIEESLNNEMWTEAIISPYFHDVLLTINSLELTDENFLHQIQSSETSQNKLIITNNDYKTVNSVLELLKTLYEYLKLIRFLKEISFEASIYLIELIKTFNSRTLELILGSGAYTNKILQGGINCWHLCLTTQCISFLIAEIPFIWQ